MFKMPKIFLRPFEGMRKAALEKNKRTINAKNLLRKIYGLGNHLDAISDKTSVTVGTKKYALHDVRAVDALKKMLEQKKEDEPVDISDTLKNHEKAIQTYVQTHHDEKSSGFFVKDMHFIERAPVAKTRHRLTFNVKGKLSNAVTIAKALWGLNKTSADKKAA